MRVPTIDELGDLFESVPMSVAETSVGQFMGLERWPEGEVRCVYASSDATVTVFISPVQRRMSIDLTAPETKVSLGLCEVLAIDASTRHGIKELTIEFGHQEPVENMTLRLRPDVRLDWHQRTS